MQINFNVCWFTNGKNSVTCTNWFSFINTTLSPNLYLARALLKRVYNFSTISKAAYIFNFESILRYSPISSCYYSVCDSLFLGTYRIKPNIKHISDKYFNLPKWELWKDVRNISMIPVRAEWNFFRGGLINKNFWN